MCVCVCVIIPHIKIKNNGTKTSNKINHLVDLNIDKRYLHEYPVYPLIESALTEHQTLKWWQQSSWSWTGMLSFEAVEREV